MTVVVLQTHMAGLAALGALLACALVAPEVSRGAAEARPDSPTAPDPRASRQGARPEAEALNGTPLKLPLRDPKVVIEKGARRLTLYSGGERVRVFPVGLGFAPEGDKARQGDGRTPEGTFYVCVKNARSRFYLSLGLSYPGAEDAARGLRDGIITRAEHDRIARAIKNRRRPPWDTQLGGEIFIHGGGSASDWTFGCVALENGQIRELFDAVPLGTQVVIEP